MTFCIKKINRNISAIGTAFLEENSFSIISSSTIYNVRAKKIKSGSNITIEDADNVLTISSSVTTSGLLSVKNTEDKNAMILIDNDPHNLKIKTLSTGDNLSINNQDKYVLVDSTLPKPDTLSVNIEGDLDSEFVYKSPEGYKMVSIDIG